MYWKCLTVRYKEGSLRRCLREMVERGRLFARLTPSRSTPLPCDYLRVICPGTCQGVACRH